MSTVDETWENLLSYLDIINKFGPNHANLRKAIPNIFESHISDLVLYDDLLEPKDHLVHYTKWEHAMKMFCDDTEKPSLRMYNLERSNDPKEGEVKPKEWQQIEKTATWIDDALENDPHWNSLEPRESAYCCSFSVGPSGVEDDLMYWRMYGNDGEGCSLRLFKRDQDASSGGIRSDDRQTSVSSTNRRPVYGKFRAYKVRYRSGTNYGRSKKGNIRFKRNSDEVREDEKVANRLRDVFSIGKEIADNLGEHDIQLRRTIAKALRQILYGYYYLNKNKAYSEEKEWRMIRIMPSPNTVRFDTHSTDSVKRYIEGPPLINLLMSNSVMTVGPTVHNAGAARAYLEHLARKKEIAGVDVVNSDTTYRSF